MKKTLSYFITFLLALSLFSGCKEHEENKADPPVSMMIWGDQKLLSPINVKVSEELLAEFSAEDYNSNGHHPVEQMLMEWDKAYPKTQFFNIPTQTTHNPSYGHVQSYNDYEMGVYISHDWFSNVSASALAITQFYAVKKSKGDLGYLELIHADIILNYRYHNFSTSKSDYDSYYLPSVLLHEIGHFLGMTHQRNFATPSIMQPFLSTIDTASKITKHDRHTLTNNYNKTPLPQKGSTLFLSSITSNHQEGDIIRGVIEQRADGRCHHYINGKEILSH